MEKTIMTNQEAKKKANELRDTIDFYKAVYNRTQLHEYVIVDGDIYDKPMLKNKIDELVKDWFGFFLDSKGC